MSIQSSIVGALSSVADTVKGIGDIKASQVNQAEALKKSSVDVLNKDASYEYDPKNIPENEIKKEDNIKDVSSSREHYNKIKERNEAVKDLNLSPELRSELDKELNSAKAELINSLARRQLSKDALRNVKINADRLRWAKDYTSDLRSDVNQRLKTLEEEKNEYTNLRGIK